MNELRWDEASFFISIREALEHDVNALALFYVTVRRQILNSNVKLAFCEAIS
jgi:hypothetical protein